MGLCPKSGFATFASDGLPGFHESYSPNVLNFSIKSIGKITDLLYLITFCIQFRHFFMKAADNDGASLQFLFHYFLHFSHKGSNLALIFPLHHKSQFEAILQLLLNHITNAKQDDDLACCSLISVELQFFINDFLTDVIKDLLNPDNSWHFQLS